MAPDDRETIRELLVKYEAALYLAEDLALSLLEVVQPDVIDISMDQARERRRFAADALASVEAGEDYAKKLWEAFGLERRKGPPSTAYKGKERRRPRRRSRRSTE